MKPPYKVQSYYQVKTYVGIDTDKAVSCNSFSSYSKALKNFEAEVEKAHKKYLVELLSVVEIQEVKDIFNTIYLTLGDNL